MDERPPPPPYTPFGEYAYAPAHPQAPPALPPRGGAPPASSSSLSHGLSPAAGPSVSSTFLHDPRPSSQASLRPTRSRGRRTLLLVYIHGFMGNETSFQSFPAHLHNLLTVTLGNGGEEDAYLVHTKVYPKFETRHVIGVATLEFSKWLSEFESDTTDIVLLGHSMGGILGAEVVLLPSFYSPDARRHPGILGMIAFDTPFLGMHPGIISSGLASLFRPAPSPAPSPGQQQQQTPEGELDPFFAQRPQRNFTIVPSPKPPSPWMSTLHFISKNHEHLTQATGKYLMSHLEFGACLADPIGLRNRYAQIRGLEDGKQTQDGRVDRVRFANYFTISYGREKGVVAPPPMPADMSDDMVGGSGGSYAIGSALEASMSQLSIVGGGAATRVHSRTPSGSSTQSMTPQSGMSTPSMQLQDLEPEPMSQGSDASEYADPAHSPQPPPLTTEMSLPDPGAPRPAVQIVPPTPVSPETSLRDVEALFQPISAPPSPPTLRAIPESAEKTLRKALEKENKRKASEYDRQLKGYAKLVKAREKVVAKVYQGREKERRKQGKEKARADEEKERQDKLKLAGSRRALQEEEVQRRDREKRELERQELERQKHLEPEKKERLEEKEKEPQRLGGERVGKSKPPRKRKFCITPSQPDETWTPVEMRGVDEVGAHCGLFFVGEVYAKLVGDVADRIEGWINDERTRRLVEQSDAGDCGWENHQPSTTKRAY